MSKGTKRLTTTVTAQTHYHLYRLAAMAGYSSPGRVIDKLVRDHLNAMRYGDTTNKPNKGGNFNPRTPCGVRQQKRTKKCGTFAQKV